MRFLNRAFLACSLTILLVMACVSNSGGIGEWWSGQGPVIAHQSFPANCSLCHTTESWQKLKADVTFDHEAETGVVLAGAHAEAQCLRCHNDRGPVQTFASRGCAGCHVDTHEGRLGQNCESCHDEQTWRPRGQIAEHGRTRFPLMGIHAAVTCDRCHPGIGSGNFEPLNPECSSCHQADLAAAKSPNHVAQGWIDRCDRCHLPTSWGGGGFRHDGFRLVGAHKAADCEACHVGGVFSGLGQQCADCHLDEYTSVGDPDHVAMNFSQSCDNCHSSNAWLPANFSHKGISSACVDCHLPEYNATTDPNHALQGYAQTCQDCHSTKAWLPANFDHSGITSGCVDCHLDAYNQTTDPDHVASGFSTECQDCHGTKTWEGGNFDHQGITNGCVDCHLEDYNQTTDPDHIAEGYSTECQDCHNSTDTWDGAVFDHNGITNGCVDCHLDEYNQTTDPDHDAAGFPILCQVCHGTRQWEGANFDHNFPIDSGDHKNFDCIDCHTIPSNYMAFSCTHCHDHRQSKMADEHKDVGSYIWESNACYSCHPNGEED
jgi:hypothetical protein